MPRRRARLSAAAIWARVSFAAGRVGGLAQQLESVGGVQVLEGLQRGREVLAQLVPQPLHGPGALPDQRLMGARHHLDRRSLRAVPGCRAQLVGVGTHHVSEHVRVAGIALGAGHAVAFPVPRGLQRVDRIHGVPGRDQGRHPRAAVGLDPDCHLRILRILGQVPADQLMQLRDPGHALRQPPLRQHPARLVHHLHIVVVLSPVIPHEQPHRLSRPRCRIMSAACGRTISALIKQCSRPRVRQAGTTSQQRSTLPGHRQGHALAEGLKVLGGRVLTCRRPPGTESARCGPGSSY